MQNEYKHTRGHDRQTQTQTYKNTQGHTQFIVNTHVRQTKSLNNRKVSNDDDAATSIRTNGCIELNLSHELLSLDTSALENYESYCFPFLKLT